MKTEPYLHKGKFIEGFEADTVGDVICTAKLFKDIPKGSKEDIAYSMTKTVVDQLVNKACDSALSKGIDHIGLTGGVSYNSAICRMVEDSVSERGLRFIMHDKVPCGDGGISLGQEAIAQRLLD